MALDFERWPEVLDVGVDILMDDDSYQECDDEFAPELTVVGSGFLEFETDAMTLEDRPGGLVLNVAGLELARREAEASVVGGRVKKRRRPRVRPPEKSPEEVASNAARFHAWQRGEREVPPVWSAAEAWVRVR